MGSWSLIVGTLDPSRHRIPSPVPPHKVGKNYEFCEEMCKIFTKCFPHCEGGDSHEVFQNLNGGCRCTQKLCALTLLVLRVRFVDFTLSNARQFYLSMSSGKSGLSMFILA